MDAKTHPYISTGLKNNKFGIAFDRALDVYRRAAAMSHIRIVGVDCHIGSQLTNDKPLQEAMERIVALADVYDALTSKRCYKEAFPHDHARSIIQKESGAHFDPRVVAAFLAAEEDFLQIQRQYRSDIDHSVAAPVVV